MLLKTIHVKELCLKSRKNVVEEIKKISTKRPRIKNSNKTKIRLENA